MPFNRITPKAENAYKHWKETPCSCRRCALFRLMTKSWRDIEFMIGFKNGFEDYWIVFKEKEIKDELENHR